MSLVTTTTLNRERNRIPSQENKKASHHDVNKDHQCERTTTVRTTVSLHDETIAATVANHSRKGP